MASRISPNPPNPPNPAEFGGIIPRTPIALELSTMSGHWTPTPFDLRAGLPFTYDDDVISQISNTEAFNTGIDIRDTTFCVICGSGDGRVADLEHAHIVSKTESSTICL
jgi:hypothetical protein